MQHRSLNGDPEATTTIFNEMRSIPFQKDISCKGTKLRSEKSLMVTLRSNIESINHLCSVDVSLLRYSVPTEKKRVNVGSFRVVFCRWVVGL